MKNPVPFRSLALAVPVLFAAPAASQTCPNVGDNFWKNDSLPQNPGGPTGVSIIQGICENEAAGAFFTMPPGPPQKLTQVSVGFGHAFGTNGFQAVMNVEIYDGVTWIGSLPSMGTKVFDLEVDATSNVQVSSHGINAVDMTPYNVIVQDDFVVAFRMRFNLSFPGCPPFGAQANFMTDNASPVGSCPAQNNLLDELSQGWIDPATGSVLGTPLCPLFYAGNWVIRACTEDSGAPASATVRNGSGVNPLWFQSVTLPQIGTNWISSVDVAAAGAPFSFVAAVFTGPVTIPLAIGELLIDISGPPGPISPGFGAHSVGIPNDVGLIGFDAYTQGATFNAGLIQLTNAIDLIVGL